LLTFEQLFVNIRVRVEAKARHILFHNLYQMLETLIYKIKISVNQKGSVCRQQSLSMLL
jgi:hypothetical protein